MSTATATKKTPAAKKQVKVARVPDALAQVLETQHAEKKPAAKKPANPQRKPGRRSLEIEYTPGGHVPKIIILGRGQLDKRRLFACRLHQSTMDRLHSLTSGPDYLLVDLAVNRLCDALELASTTEIIKAEDLG